jgi:putative salt-induced outer membrane protein YdiY
MRALPTAVVLALILGLAAGCATTPGEATAPAEKTKVGKPWHPPAPEPDGFDWVRLTSGEWLKGEIKVLREESLEFESDKLDTLNLDWEDVAEVRSPRQVRVLFDDDEIAVGTLLMKETRVQVGTKQYDRSQVLAILPGKPDPLGNLSGKVSLGLTARSGNTNQSDLTLAAWIRRRTLDSRSELKYVGNLGELEGSQTVNNHRLTGYHQMFVTRHFYIAPLSFEAFRDRFSNIDLRFTPIAGVGYRLLDTKDTEWTVDAGAGVRYTSFVSVEPGADESEWTLAGLLGTGFESELTDKIDLTMSYTAQIGIPDTNDTNQNAEITFSIDLVGELDLNVSFFWDRVGRPAATASGEVPEKDDFRLVLGLGWEF